MERVRINGIIWLLLLILAISGVAAALAADVKTSSGPISDVFTSINNTSEITTYSPPLNPPDPDNPWVEMTSLSFTLKKKTQSQLLITFSAKGRFPFPGSYPAGVRPRARIQCLLDGNVVMPFDNTGSGGIYNYPFTAFTFPTMSAEWPGETMPAFDSRSFTWVVPLVTGGTHTVTIQWYLYPINDATVEVLQRSLVVQASTVK